jgi:hypothetical protein
MKKRWLIVPLAFFLIQAAHAQNKEIGAFVCWEYDRKFYHYGAVQAVGAVEFDNRYLIRGGISLGKTQFDAGINAFGSARFDPKGARPLHFALAYIYNGLPDYDVHAHTLLPLIAYKGRRTEVAAGTTFRFTSFFSEPALLEAILAFSVCFYFIDNEIFSLAISWGNFDDFSARALGAYSFSLNSILRLSSSWFLVNEIELKQSGSLGLSAAFYGIAWRGGVRFAW